MVNGKKYQIKPEIIEAEWACSFLFKLPPVYHAVATETARARWRLYTLPLSVLLRVKQGFCEYQF